MTENEIEKTILYILVFVLFGTQFLLLMNMLPMAYTLLVYLFKEVKIQEWIPILIGVIAIYIAKNSLDFSKRSSLVKDSYEPLLNDLRANKGIKMSSVKKLKFKEFEVIQESYLFEALEKKDREYIECILAKTEEINKNKFLAIGKARDIFIDEMNELFTQSQDELKIGEIKIIKGEYQGREKSYPYEMLLKGDLFYRIIFTQDVMNFVLGRFECLYFEDSYEPDKIFHPKKETEFTRYVCRNKKVRLYEESEDNVVHSGWDKIERNILEKFKEEHCYIDLKTSFEELEKLINEYDEILIERIKKLLIPNYRGK